MDIQIQKSDNAIGALCAEWRTLHTLRGKFPFTDPTLVEAWWRSRGVQRGQSLHIVTGHRDGALVAVAPLSVYRYRGIKILAWAGGDVFDFCDILTEND